MEQKKVYAIIKQREKFRFQSNSFNIYLKTQAFQRQFQNFNRIMYALSVIFVKKYRLKILGKWLCLYLEFSHLVNWFARYRLSKLTSIHHISINSRGLIFEPVTLFCLNSFRASIFISLEATYIKILGYTVIFSDFKKICLNNYYVNNFSI